MAKAKLFMTGGSQAVRLPAEFRFEGSEVEIRRDPITKEFRTAPPLLARRGHFLRQPTSAGCQACCASVRIDSLGADGADSVGGEQSTREVILIMRFPS